jgi:hypothetical protein
MRARAVGRTFEDRSWNGVVSRIVAAYKLETTAAQRVAAANDLANGRPVVISGVSVTPL